MMKTSLILLHSDQSPRLFDAEALGASFQQLAVDVVRGDATDFMSRWYRSAQGEADLVIWTDGEKRIIKHQLSFFGQVVDWNPLQGTRTGLIIEEEVGSIEEDYTEDPPEADVAEIIRFDRSAQNSVIHQAIQLLVRIPDLNESDRSSLIFNLKQSPKLHKRARERAMKTWASKVDEITSTRRPTFWKRLKTWVLGD